MTKKIIIVTEKLNLISRLENLTKNKIHKTMLIQNQSLNPTIK
jgi:hypothetical protein